MPAHVARPASRQSATRAKQWWWVLFVQEYDKKRETKNRERQLYHLRHSNDYDMLELPMGASKVRPPAARCSKSLGHSCPELAPPSQHGSAHGLRRSRARQPAAGSMHRAWLCLLPAPFWEAGRELDMPTILRICISKAGLPNCSAACHATCWQVVLLAIWLSGWLAMMHSGKAGRSWEGANWNCCSNMILRLADHVVQSAGGRQAGIQKPGQEVASGQASPQPGRG